jgi:glycosyltransferase involved in cell wall biosynthesis
MNPRILQIVSADNGTPAAKQLLGLSRGLAANGFDVHICEFVPSDMHAAHQVPAVHGTLDVPIAAIPLRWRFDPKTYWQLKRLVERFQPDLIHAWSPVANCYALAAAKSVGVNRFVAGFSSIDPFKSGTRLALDRYVARRSAQLTANSPAVRDFYVQKGLPADKFRVIPRAVEPPRPSASTRKQLLAELGLADNSRLIGLLTDLLLRNGVKDAIWAADLLKVIRKDVHLLIIGDGLHRGQLRRFRNQVRIGDLVHFLGPRADVDRLMPHFDLLWSTSPYEGPSGPILEAMAAAVPVVAADSPATRELLSHGQTGFRVRVGDRAAYARFAHQLLEDPVLSRRIGRSAQQRALCEFSPEKAISAYVEMYRQLFGSSPHTRSAEP